jgi:plasmid stabilization system protein ParE
MPWVFAGRERAKSALKNRESRRLARPRKRHYTFARRRLDHVTTVRVRHGAIASSKR